MGTPHRGSTVASWAALASNLAKFVLEAPNDKLLKGLKPNNELLESLRSVFLQMLEDNKFKIYSFYETKSMLGIYWLKEIVPFESCMSDMQDRKSFMGLMAITPRFVNSRVSLTLDSKLCLAR